MSHRQPTLSELNLVFIEWSSRSVTTVTPPGWDASPSQGTQHEVTGSITTPPGWDASPTQGTQHEVTRSITTPPGWDASSSQGTRQEVTRSITTPHWMECQSITGYPAWSDWEYYYSPLDGILVHHWVQHEVLAYKITPSISITVTSTHLYTLVERDSVEKSVLSKETTWQQRPVFDHHTSICFMV